MKIVITGASGYLGSRLCLFLANNGHEIIANCFFEIPQKKGWTEKISQFIIGDIRDENIIKRISESKPDIIIHLISLDHYDSEKSPQIVSDTNVLPTWNLLNSCSGKGLKKFIYFSTIHVYGKNQNGVIFEDQNITPYNSYGLTHALSEEICNFYHRKQQTECINIRLSNSYGEPVFPDAKCWNLIVNDLVRSAFLNKKIILRGDGTQVRDFIHFSDICSLVNSLVENKLNKLNTFHLSSSKSLNMIDVAIEVKKVYSKIFGEEIPIFINKTEKLKNIKNSKRNSQLISNDLIKNISHIKFKKLSEGINDLFYYLKLNNA